MDEETQKLIDRARQRREMLTQRNIGLPEAAPRKRRTPVLESDGSEKVLSEMQLNQDDSPKRPCLREKELELKSDTPAIRGVHARAKLLSENGNVHPVASPRKSMTSPPLGKRNLSPHKSPAKAMDIDTPSSARKSRFAALAKNIDNWEDDLTHHTFHKDEVKKPKWHHASSTDERNENQSPIKSNPSDRTGSSPLRSAAKISPMKTPAPSAKISPKKSPAPTVPGSPSALNTTPGVMASSSPRFARNSPLRGSKVELNRSPKPFSPTFKSTAKSKSEDSIVQSVTSPNMSKSFKSVSEISMSNAQLDGNKYTLERNIHTLTSVQDKTTILRKEEGKLNKIQSPQKEPSSRPLSAKLASFEQQITENTPKASFGMSRSMHVSRTPKQVCTPALSASTPARSKPCDPTDFSVSQRMSHMQNKLASVERPGTQRAKDSEPTAFPVSARMSAWENMTSSNLVSDIKKVDPASATPTKPSGYVSTPKAATPGPNGVTPVKSFKDSIADKASQVLGKKGPAVERSPTKSPQKMASSVSKSPQKMASSLSKSPQKKASSVSPQKSHKPMSGMSSSKIHSPTKTSVGTKMAQQRLAESSQELGTSCSKIAAESRAARQAELEALKHRFKNGILKQGADSESSSEGTSDPMDETTKAPANRRQAARDKAREGFNSKLAEIGMAKTESKPAQSTPSKSGSIYSIIKKKDQVKENANDSFDDSDDEGQRKIPRSAALRAAKAQGSQDSQDGFKKPAAPAPATDTDSEAATDVTDTDADKDTDALSVSDLNDEFGSSNKLPVDYDDDDISLKGFVSEAVRRESVIQPKRPDSEMSESSLDSYDYDRAKKTVDFCKKDRDIYADDSLSDDEDEEGEEGGSVDALLDEALSNSEESETESCSSTTKHRRDEYDPDMDPNNVQMRRRPQNPSRQLYTSTTDDDEEDSRPYSLQAYRKSANMQKKTLESVSRVSKYVGMNVREDTPERPTAAPRAHRDDTRAVQDRIKELQELVQQEQTVIMQTSKALNNCCLGNSLFAGSAEQVECNRVLLIACQKRQGYMHEIQRLKASGSLHPEGPGPQGSLTISDIRLPLKKEFVTKIGTSQDTVTYYFILLIKHGCQVICTQMLSTHDPMMRGSLDFPNLIKINGITSSFKLTLDIYSMNIQKDVSKDKKKNKTPKKTPKKGYGMGSLESPGGPTAVRTTSFSHVTSLPLTMRALDKGSFALERLPFLSPLYGQIFMRLKCLMESNVEERGFLTMFDDVSGFGAWHRRWVVLAGNKLCIWKYPDDETRKDPMLMIELKRCITEKVGQVSRDVCARPHTFEIMTVRQPLRGERDTLVTQTHSTMTSVRYLMSADSKEERIVWSNKLNRALTNLRTWNSDALKPMKASSSRR